MEIQDFLIAAIQNITVLIKQPQSRMSKSNEERIDLDKYLKRKGGNSLPRFFVTVIVGRLNMALRFV